VAVVTGEEGTLELVLFVGGNIVQVVHAFFQQKWRSEKNRKERKTMNKMKDIREVIYFFYFVMVVEWGWFRERNDS
jgi:hypothetical protein